MDYVPLLVVLLFFVYSSISSYFIWKAIETFSFSFTNSSEKGTICSHYSKLIWCFPQFPSFCFPFYPIYIMHLWLSVCMLLFQFCRRKIVSLLILKCVQVNLWEVFFTYLDTKTSNLICMSDMKQRRYSILSTQFEREFNRKKIDTGN